MSWWNKTNRRYIVAVCFLFLAISSFVDAHIFIGCFQLVVSVLWFHLAYKYAPRPVPVPVNRTVQPTYRTVTTYYAPVEEEKPPTPKGETF